MDTITPHALAFAPGQMQLVTGTGSGCTSPTAETGVMSGAGSGLFGVALSLAGGIAGQAWRTRANA